MKKGKIAERGSSARAEGIKKKEKGLRRTWGKKAKTVGQANEKGRNGFG